MAVVAKCVDLVELSESPFRGIVTFACAKVTKTHSSNAGAATNALGDRTFACIRRKFATGAFGARHDV
ncbi:MAG: hypothetical protein FWH07_00010 [Oscillospiraceae bacterium]|nr:hypothetical protein [Oscillospiraceae bacterium]